MSSQLRLPAAWAFRESKADPQSRLSALRTDAADARARIREVLDGLAARHGISPATVSAAMDYADDMLGDTVYDAEQALEREIESGDPA